MQSHLRNDLLYLLHVIEAAEKISLYAGEYDDPLLFFEANDGREWNACLMLLVQIGEQAGKLSNELKDKYKEINWKEVKAFCNRAVHDYTGLDRFITFTIIKQNVPTLIPTVSTIINMELKNGNFDKEEFLIAARSPYLTHVHFTDIWKDSE